MKDLEDGLLESALPLLLEDYLEEVKPETDEGQEIHDIVKDSYFDSSYDTHWKPVRTEIVKNTHLETEYEEKRQDYLIRGRKPEELEEKWGFILENNVATLETNTAVGLQTHESDYNPLGYGRLGIYVCKHADIQLQHALIKHSGSDVLRLLIVKYIGGRSTSAIPRPATSSEFIEPTQGYDCHISALPPQPTDPLQTQFDRSQVFLFEINKLLQPSTRPRQVLPYAVVTYTENGQYVPSIDIKPTPKEKLAGNPRLQEIIKAINAKGTQEQDKNSLVQSKSGAGLLQGPSLGASMTGGKPGSIPGVQTAAAATGIPLVNGASKIVNGTVLMNGAHSPIPLADMGTNPQLKMIISRINARLDNEPKPAANGKPAQGDGILGIPPSATNGSVVSNGSIGSNSPLGSRPGSADEALLSGVAAPTIPVSNHMFTSSKAMMSPCSVALSTHMALKAQQPPTVSLPTMHPTISSMHPTTMLGGLGTLGGLVQPAAAAAQSMQNAAFLAAAATQHRKDPLTLDYGALPFSQLYPGAQPVYAGQPVYADRLQGALQFPSAYPTAAGMTTLASTATLAATMQQNAFVRPGLSVKRAFPDATGTLEWDKRPKFF